MSVDLVDASSANFVRAGTRGPADSAVVAVQARHEAAAAQAAPAVADPAAILGHRGVPAAAIARAAVRAPTSLLAHPVDSTGDAGALSSVSYDDVRNERGFEQAVVHHAGRRRQPRGELRRVAEVARVVGDDAAVGAR